MVERVPASSIDYLRIPVTETTGNVDPTSLPVAVALMDDQYSVGQTEWLEPAEDDWQAGEWAPDDGPPWFARLLVADVTGDFQVWLRITGDPEVPVRRAGRLVKGHFEEASS